MLPDTSHPPVPEANWEMRLSMTGRPPWRPLRSSRKAQPRATSSQEPQASSLSPGAVAPRDSPLTSRSHGAPKEGGGWGLAGGGRART